jgi:hypothetical protein
VRNLGKVYFEEIKRDGDENSKIDHREIGCDGRICIDARESLKQQRTKLNFRPRHSSTG